MFVSFRSPLVVASNITSRVLEGLLPSEQASKSTNYACSHTHVAPMGIWPCHRTLTCQGGSNKLNFELILTSGCWVPVSARFQDPSWHSWACQCSMCKWLWCCISTGQRCSNGLNFGLIRPTDVESRHLQEFRGPHCTHRHNHVATMGKWLWHRSSTGRGNC